MEKTTMNATTATMTTLGRVRNYHPDLTVRWYSENYRYVVAQDAGGTCWAYGPPDGESGLIGFGDDLDGQILACLKAADEDRVKTVPAKVCIELDEAVEVLTEEYRERLLLGWPGDTLNEYRRFVDPDVQILTETYGVDGEWQEVYTGECDQHTPDIRRTPAGN